MLIFFYFIPITILCLCICLLAGAYVMMGFKSMSVRNGVSGGWVSVLLGLSVICITLFVYFKYCWFFSW